MATKAILFPTQTLERTKNDNNCREKEHRSSFIVIAVTFSPFFTRALSSSVLNGVYGDAKAAFHYER